MDELYDWQEFALKRVIGPALTMKWGKKMNTQKNLTEFTKEAQEICRKRAGVKIDINMMPVIMGGSPEIVVMENLAVNNNDFDYERKRWEVLLAKEKGEQHFLGEKDGKSKR